MRHTTPRNAATTIALVLALVVSALAATTAVAHADPPFPYRAFGSGLDAGQVVEAYDGAVLVGRTVADRRGNWIVDVWPPAAHDGDTITFELDSVKTGAVAIFHAGHFTPPPGLSLRPGRTTPVAPAHAATPRVTSKKK